MIYVIGSLRNPEVPTVASALRKEGFDVFDDWYAAGRRADDSWRDYEVARGHSYVEALGGHSARHVFDFDEFHLNRAAAGVLVMPAGKSGHLEIGYLAGQSKPTWILSSAPKRYDVMTQFTTVCLSLSELMASLKEFSWPKHQYIVNIHLTEALWLAGLLEGEGTFVCDSMNGRSRPRPRIALQTTDEDVAKKAARLLDAKVWGPYTPAPPRKPVWATAVTGLKAATYMKVLCPYMGARRQKRMKEILSVWDPYHYKTWRARP